MKSSIILLFILSIFSCNDNRKELESEYQKCINDKTFERGILYPLGTPDSDVEGSISVFDSIKKFENYLYKTEHLFEISKSGYSELVIEIEKTEVLKKEFKDFNSKHPFINNNLMTSLFFEELFYHCVLSSFKNQIHYDYLLETRDKVQLNSYPNSEILTELLNKIEFQSETQRLILTYLIYNNLFSKYEMG